LLAEARESGQPGHLLVVESAPEVTNSMAKFALIAAAGGKIMEYEGDYMKQIGEHVTIYKTTQGFQVPDTDPQVGAVKLDKGQSVMKIKD
jgi:hypothetical protein